MSGLAGSLRTLLDDVQRTLFERARAFRDDHTQRVASYEEFKQVMDGRPGFVIAPWCGSAECEARIKDETRATIRVITDDAEAGGGDPCVSCGRPATRRVLFAQAY
jgi:prolyl-tRNA synthetase